MGNLIGQILVNIASNLLTLVPGVFLFALFVRNRQQLFKFFGIKPSIHKVDIYLSRLEIKEGGTTGVEGEDITVGYYGPAINFVEYQAALQIHDLFHRRILAWLPEGFIVKPFFAFSKIIPDIRISPHTQPEMKRETDERDKNGVRNLILIGDGTYNIYSQSYLKNCSPDYVFKKVNGIRSVIGVQGTFKNKLIEGRKTKKYKKGEKQVAIIQRFLEPIGSKEGHNRTVFLCAGTGSAATCASVRYLIDNWQTIHKAVKPTDTFSILLTLEMPRDIKHIDDLEGYDNFIRAIVFQKNGVEKNSPLGKILPSCESWSEEVQLPDVQDISEAQPNIGHLSSID